MKNTCMTKNIIVNKFNYFYQNQQVVGIMVKKNNYFVY